MAPVKYIFVSAGLLVSVMADYVAFTEWPAALVAGEPVMLRWMGGNGAPATITLRKGQSTDLQDVQVLSKDANNGEFSWTPPTDLQNGDNYAFEISQGDENNYTGSLSMTGGSDTPKENVNGLNKTKSTESMSNSASTATDTASKTAVTDSTATGTASATETTGSTASDATATTTFGATASDGSSATTSGAETTETALASHMNTPFVGSHQSTSTATSSSSVQTGAAGRVGIPLAFLAGAAGFLFLFV
ncbi:hypothetical protein EYB25_008747 [Talaromyces marneffei]|uniref:uncharacterized protein n=1 Tax=Talaromyces marneffei TaxID=37727 RepID=UPI0012AA6104|nr:uncharacterized protein EYB26_009422 [Talaromyces marneffei]KAE8548369.1 hypothetical protein EYB25_008747 [Talaromyces marneffei]QGA21711.1 hypothetical protein EYB26_009422 [Talaromyces marneffei]